METFWHITQRELLHLVFSPVAYLSSFFAMRWLYRRWPNWSKIIFPAIVAFAFIAPREAFDVWNGGSIVKSTLDLAFWSAGLSASAWAVMKYTDWEN